MNQGKTTREDCRGKVFSEPVMLDTPRETALSSAPDRSVHTMAAGKSDDNKSRNRID